MGNKNIFEDLEKFGKEKIEEEKQQREKEIEEQKAQLEEQKNKTRIQRRQKISQALGKITNVPSDVLRFVSDKNNLKKQQKQQKIEQKEKETLKKEQRQAWLEEERKFEEDILVKALPMMSKNKTYSSFEFGDKLVKILTDKNSKFENRTRTPVILIERGEEVELGKNIKNSIVNRTAYVYDKDGSIIRVNFDECCEDRYVGPYTNNDVKMWFKFMNPEVCVNGKFTQMGKVRWVKTIGELEEFLIDAVGKTQEYESRKKRENDFDYLDTTYIQFREKINQFVIEEKNEIDEINEK